MANRNRKLLSSVLVLGVIGSVAGWGAFSAFTATTSNAGNEISAGSVVISQHAGATTLYSTSNQRPGDPISKCVRVTYGGSLTAAVKLYVSSGVTNGSAFNVKVERGSGLASPDATMNCTGFSSESTAYNGGLGSFPTTYAGGVAGKAGADTWDANQAVDYRFTISVVDDATPNAHTSSQGSGSHTFTWEARNS